MFGTAAAAAAALLPLARLRDGAEHCQLVASTGARLVKVLLDGGEAAVLGHLRQRGEDRSGAQVPGVQCYLPGRGGRPRPGLLAAHLQVLPLAAGVEAEAGAARLGGLWNRVDVMTRLRGRGC